MPAGQLTLFDLATIANQEHALARQAFVSTLEHAIRAGEALSEAKAQLPHGEWLPWLDANFDATNRTAQMYMRLAANAKHVSHLIDPTLRKALDALATSTQLRPQHSWRS